MNKLETIIYIVGPKRSWEFQAKNFKRIVVLVLLIFLGLGGTILYQQYIHLEEMENAQEKLHQETLKNAKLLALLNKIKQAGSSKTQGEEKSAFDLNKQQKLNEQQSILIEQQLKQIDELKGVLRQRERVVQQFQLEKQSTQEQIISLQNQLTESKDALKQTGNEKDRFEQQLTTSREEIDSLKKLLEQKKKATAKAAKTKNRTQKAGGSVNFDKGVVGVQNLKFGKQADTLTAEFRLTNLTAKVQRGRVGMYLISPQESKDRIAYGSGKTQSYQIRRYKVIKRNFTGISSGRQFRIIVWNQNKRIILDKVYSLSS